jgi:hypothetical protein
MDDEDEELDEDVDMEELEESENTGRIRRASM